MIIALSEASAAEIRSLGGQHVRVIPMGSYAEPYAVTLTNQEARSSFGFSDDDLIIALIGRLEWYKGVDLLLRAVAQLPVTSSIKLLLAGFCPEEDYRNQLNQLAAKAEGRVVAEFRWIPDDELARYFQAIDIAVFPFREITNSGSVLLAQSFGKPVVIPDLTVLGDIPREGAMRFTSGQGQDVDRLVEALNRAEQLTESQYRDMSIAALSWARRNDWETIARETVEVYQEALNRPSTGQVA
jgi:glycosyltransferase involved in cell wall biosynthesis